jgi:uncharacterized integral membrane protein
MSMDWKANERQSEAPRGDKTKISPSLIIGIVVAILVVVFIVQNAKDSQVKFLFWDGTISLWVVIVISLILGALLDRLVTWYMRRRSSRKAE